MLSRNNPVGLAEATTRFDGSIEKIASILQSNESTIGLAFAAG